MVIQKKASKKAAVKASNKVVRRRPIKAEDEVVEDEIVEDADIEVAPEASDLLFEAEDVAELVAEITGEDVAVEADENVVTFEIGDDVYTVEAEDEVEILESTKRPLQNKQKVSASKKVVRRNRAAVRK